MSTDKQEQDVVYQAVDATTGMLPTTNATPYQAVAVPEPRVKVIAPSSLPGGYRLHVHVNGEPKTVIVPEGGVKEGQEFEAVVATDGAAVATLGGNESNPHNIPSQSWRDGLFSCCAHGVCHPMCCLATWCTPIALGQVMTRMKLGPCGHYDPNPKYTAFKVLLISCLGVLLFNEIVTVLASPYRAEPFIQDEYGNMVSNPNMFVDGTPGWAKLMEGLNTAVEIGYAAYILLVFYRTRTYLKSQYRIPSDCCGEADSIFVGLCCQCCGVTQMARHTADYETYGASCCNETGLNESVPPSVV